MGLHRVSDPQKSKRIELWEEPLSIIGSQKRRAWHIIIILDEFWFYFWTGHEVIWPQTGEEVPEKE
jgi:hypothetical protein